MCVRYLHREALKELLVDGVEEVLFLREVLAERGSVLDSSIERVQRFEKLVATEGVPNEYLDNVFDLACDDISAREVRVVEDGTEDPFRQQMLDEHLLNGSRGEVWVDCGTALLVEIREGGDKLRVRRVLLLYKFCCLSAECGDHLFKFCDSSVPIFKRSGRCGEEVSECCNQACWIGDVCVKDLFSVLIEDTALRVLEEDIVERIAYVAFLLHGSVEVVHILRFPIREGDSVCVEDHTVKDDAVTRWGAHRVLRDEGGIHLFCAGIE